MVNVLLGIHGLVPRGVCNLWCRVGYQANGGLVTGGKKTSLAIDAVGGVARHLSYKVGHACKVVGSGKPFVRMM